MNITGQKLTHMIHAEDLILQGKEGFELALNSLKEVYKFLKKEESTSHITLKVDGSVSIVAATDYYGTQFVATKGFFNKNPKYATSLEECDELYGDTPGLNEKLKTAFLYLPLINIPKNEVWQGDFLFIKDSLVEQNINGINYITFLPNTILYAVPEDSPLYDVIKNSYIGIVWHTRYRGYSKDTLSISFDIKASELSPAKGAYMIDPSIPDFNYDVFNEEEKEFINESLHQIENSDIEELSDKLISYINQYRNYTIKKDKEVSEEGLIEFINSLFDKELLAKKTDKGKASVEERRNNILNEIDQIDIENIFNLQNHIINVKNLFISKLDNLSQIKTFVQYNDGRYEQVGQEGYAVSDKEGNVQKYVNRRQFSRNNFNPSIRKGWTSDRRTTMAESIDKNEILKDLLGDELSIKKTFNNNAYSVSPKEGSKVTREVAKDEFLQKIKEYPNIINVKDYMGPGKPVYESSDTTPIVEFDYVDEEEVIHFRFNFKPNSSKDAYVITKNQEEFTARYLIYVFTQSAGRGLLESDYEFTTDQLAEIEEKSIENYKNQFISVAKEIRNLMGKGKYDVSTGYYSSSDINIFNVIKGSAGLQKVRKDLFIKEGEKMKIDSWNPSDIYIADSSLTEAFLLEWNKTVEDPSATLNTFNSILEKYMMIDNHIGITGISLKQIKGGYHVEYLGYNQNTEGYVNSNIEIIDNQINIPSFNNYQKNVNIKELNFFTSINNNSYKWQYRSKGGDVMQLMSENAKGASSLRGIVPKYIIKSLYKKYGLGSEDAKECGKESLRNYTSVLVHAENEGFIVMQKNKKIATPLDLLNYCDIIESRLANPEDREAFEWNSRLVRILKFIKLLISAKQNNELNDILNIFEAAKSNDEVAPYIKIS